MNTKISQRLDEIEAINQRYGESIYAPCSSKDIAFFTDWISQHLPIDECKLREYIDFSSVANAFNFNGLFIYGIIKEDNHNVFDMNEIWWDNEQQRNYLFFGHDDLSWYCVDTLTGSYCILDKPSGSIEEIYATFDEMLEQVLSDN